jgi:hypothetical protein
MGVNNAPYATVSSACIALAYVVVCIDTAIVYDSTVIIILGQNANVIKAFTAVIYRLKVKSYLPRCMKSCIRCLWKSKLQL